ncbi:G-protein coupled receptor 157-like [Actinia tenebrosa]|uniref:G-protein coupled receptor 157-like n=1 Tax=Actinia tenebrosa TaxID=6105 RepID=A0A6P8IML9_ACTTE|nr:G-protein coupled receptor 157-like [Actinia tenebrosa]
MNLTNNQFAANTTTNLALAGITAILSMLGTTFIVLTYLLWNEIQSPSRRILVYISVADFFLAFGNLIGILTRSKIICLVQSIVVTFSCLSSFAWTVIMAVYLYYSCSRRKLIARGTLFCIFHTVGWGLPLSITVIASYGAKLGYNADIVTSGWCWFSIRLSWQQQVVWMLATGKFWEILSYVIISVLYYFVNRNLRKQVNQVTFNFCLLFVVVVRKKINKYRYLSFLIKSHRLLLDARSEKSVKITEVKLIIVPLIFISLHIWGTIRFFIFVQTGPTVSNPDTSWLLYFQVSLKGEVGRGGEGEVYCLSEYFYIFFNFQGIGDNAQGFANFIIFCFCTEKVQRKIRLFFSQCCGREWPSETTVTIATERSVHEYGSTPAEKKVEYDPTYADLS